MIVGNSDGVSKNELLMKQYQQNNIIYFQFENLPITHAVFSRCGGRSKRPFDTLNLSASVNDDLTTVYGNRRRAFGLFGRDTDSVVHAHLVHQNEVTRVTQQQAGQWLPATDGLITNDPTCALTMNYADCTPIFLYDPIRRAIGLGHAGWKGSVCDLPGGMVRAMQAEFGSEPATLLAGIGPTIGVCCYEVDEPLIGQVRQAFPQQADALLHWEHSQGERPHYDLQQANQLNLRRAGVTQIELAGLCTACHTSFFFSHRAEKGRTGRFGTLLMLDQLA